MTRTHATRARLSLATLAAFGLAAALPQTAHAQSFTLTFEDALNVPEFGTLAAPSTLDAATSLAAAYGGSDTDFTTTLDGVTFDNSNAAAGGGFTVFRDSYTNGVNGTDPYGSTDGALALTNSTNPPGSLATAPDTGPGDAGPDGLVFSTNAVLTSLSVATVDYGDGSTGAAHLTVTPLDASGALGPGITADLTSTLSPLDTSAFLTYAGQITGYQVTRDLGDSGYAALGGGGNYVLDDLSFIAAPEPSALEGLSLGALALAGLGWKARRRA